MASNAQAAESKYFEIQVVDSDTGRGVPMVELTLVDGTVFVTDSAGRVALNEPGLFGKDVFFHVASHGYEYPKDGFGNRGFVSKVLRGVSKSIKLNRINVAERLYRLTGRGIYRDSVLLRRKPPIKQPLLNGDVVGQDTVQSAVYDNRIYWFWGDSNRPQYPLGQFKTSGATSALPSQSRLNVAEGVDLKYFVDDQGFSRQMTPVEGEGAVWLHGLTVLAHLETKEAPELMFGHYVRLLDLHQKEEQGLVRFNHRTQTFEKWVEFDMNSRLFPQGVSLYNENGHDDYIYFCRPFPSIRIKANLEAIVDPTQYESYTCLKPGTHFKKGVNSVERNEDQQVVWDWKRDTDVPDPERLHQAIEAGFLKPSEAKLILRDPETGKFVYVKGGSVHWNEYRKRWVMIASQIGGEASFYGEIWYAESDQLEGPWQNARHILTHNKYTFYNPSHHPFFDQDGGRYIYFDGTLATTFAKTSTRIPRYDYNQIMYRLDLGSERLQLPPVNGLHAADR